VVKLLATFALILSLARPCTASCTFNVFDGRGSNGGSSAADFDAMGANDGDIEIASLGISASVTITPPARWTQIAAKKMSGLTEASYWTVMGNASPSGSWSWSGTQNFTVNIATFKTCTSNLTSVIDLSSTSSGSAAPPWTGNNITTTQPDMIVYTVTLSGCGSAATSTPTTNLAGSQLSINLVQGQTNYVLQAALGAQGTTSWTCGAASQKFIIDTIGIFPAACTGTLVGVLAC